MAPKSGCSNTLNTGTNYLILESGAKATLKMLVLVSDIGPDFNLKASKVFYGPQIRRFK